MTNEVRELEQQLEVAAEFCRQYQIESKTLSIEIAQLRAENKRLGDCYMKINSMYWNDEIFVVKNGEGFYTDKFVDLFGEF